MDARTALVYLRGQGEATWVSHHAPDARLAESPAGLLCTQADAWRECGRQMRRGLLVLADDEASRSAWVASLEAAAREAGRPIRVRSVVEGTSAAAALAVLGTAPDAPAAEPLVLLSGPLSATTAAAALAPFILELQVRPSPREEDRPHGPSAGADAEPLLTVPAGSFLRGSPESEPGRWSDEGPRAEVHIEAFRMGRLPVTNDAFAGFLAACPDEPLPAYWSDPAFGAPGRPVVGVGFAQAGRYATWAGGRLPSEAEWEYACRAGSTGARYGTLDAIAWHAGNSDGRLHAAGGREPNAFGLQDLLGNAWEWVADDRHDSYVGAPTDGRAWMDPPGVQPAQRVLRGGSWADSPRTVRAATRLTGHPGPRVGNIGLRVAADLPKGGG